MKAVIPAAGLGTRFLPATKNSPKEMLPLVDRPAIQYVVEEAVASGITDIVIITGRGKRAIEDHFDRNFELEHLLGSKGDQSMMDEMRRIAEMAEIHYVRQRETRGLGHAILCAKNHIGDEPFAVLLGDDVCFSSVPALSQLLQRHQKYRGSVLSVENVPQDRVSSYGVIEPGSEVEPGLFTLTDLVEKPRPNEAPSQMGILGRYVLTPEIFDALERTSPGRNGEIQLTDAIKLLLEDQAVYASVLEGKRYDLGNKLEWLKTNVEVALMREEFREPMLEFLQALIAQEEPMVTSRNSPSSRRRVTS
ncbi:MAG TPA: UTP--glucose-1-phosphate uridylyltransferase GalU [Candidatus Thermoplasmatota archaeon]|nr:UTP--glucose-1-phosphate uridylyltransferase GalU [Candidatus Thermoplasmatota archaeon]